MKVSVVIPVFNEEKRLPYFFKNLSDRNDLEIYFILNGCQDRSEEVIQSSISSFQQTRFHCGSSRKGKGAAIIRGLQMIPTTSDVSGWTDADGSIPWEELITMAAHCREKQISVFGERKAEIRNPRRQKISRFANAAASWLAGRSLPRDIGCPAKFFPRDKIPHLKEKGWGIDMEAVLLTSDFRVMKVTGRDIQGSHFRFYSAILNALNTFRLILLIRLGIR